jgi:acetyl-CoA synthetase
MESLHPLVSGVTSIIDEAEFDAMRWYSIPKSKSNYLVYCAHGNQALNAYGGHKAKRSIQSENLRSILSVGEPLNAEAVIWGEENFDPLLWTIGGKRKRRYYDSQLSFNVKPGSMGKPLPGVEIVRSTVSS